MSKKRLRDAAPPDDLASDGESFHSLVSSLDGNMADEVASGSGERRLGQAAVRAEIVVSTAAPDDHIVKRKKKQKRVRKTLTTKGRRAVVLNVLASVEAKKMVAGPAPGAAATAAADGGRGAPEVSVPAAPLAQQPPAAAAVANHTCKLGKAWSKVDLAKLARLAEDGAYLHELIPTHPEGELDWELIARHFGRYSKHGAAVRNQYLSVKRIGKEARREGRNGANYVDLVQQALQELPER